MDVPIADIVRRWNAAVLLPTPTLAEVRRALQVFTTIRVFEHTKQIQWAFSNLLVMLGPVGTEDPESPVFSMTLAFDGAYFHAPVDSRVRMTDLRNVRWFGERLPCAATQLLDAIRQQTGERLGLITESDAAGLALAWKVRAGAMEFEFEPTSAASNPEFSTLLSLTWSFNVAHSFSASPQLSLA